MQAAASVKQLAGTYDETYRIVRPDGTVRWVRDRAYPIQEANGASRRIVGVAEDVTHEREMETKFLQTQRLEAIGTLSSGIAHDLNNILAPMLMATSLLRPELPDVRSRELIAMIESGAQRGANIIRQLLTFSRGIEGQRVAVQLRHLILEMADIARETFPRDITVSEKVGRDLRIVIGDATQLHQVLMNLCVNARDAMPSGGQLKLRAENVTLTGPLEASDAKPGDYVLLTVADSGEGIPPAIIERVFDPFFTTKALGKGTGLGLSTVLGIVKSHGGFVTVKSVAGEGTAFAVYLPVGTETAAALPSQIARPRRGHGELLLVVDDEVAIRRATCETLEQWNYRVISAGHGEAGLAVFRERRHEVRLAVIDLMMPVMGGQALIKALLEVTPGLPIVAVTGLAPAEKHAELRALGVKQIIPKPFLPQQLLEVIAQELGD